MALQATDVFTPGTFPQHTYVERGQQNLERILGDALSTSGQVVSLSGPSKSGKTVLIERVVGKESLIAISGASIQKAEDVWNRVFEWMNLPDSTSTSQTLQTNAGLDVSASGSIGLPVLAKVGMTTTGRLGGSLASVVANVRQRRGLSQVVAEIANSDFVVLLDDFHYMHRDVQTEVAKTLKEAVRLNIKIATAVVSHRGDDVLRANPELRGRVHTIDLQYWTREELAQIAKAGFSALNAFLVPEIVDRFSSEAAGSPQLMQSLCLQTCFVMDLRKAHEGTIPLALNLDNNSLQRVMEQTSAATDYRSLVDVLDDGPRTRGVERKTYRFNDGTAGDVYTVLLKAVAIDPPQLSFSYDELLQRTAKVCEGESPVGSSVTGTCAQMSKLALDKFPMERTIDWDEGKLVFDLPDPYLMFYLRWSGRLKTSV